MVSEDNEMAECSGSAAKNAASNFWNQRQAHAFSLKQNSAKRQPSCLRRVNKQNSAKRQPSCTCSYYLPAAG
jgi:hypothetical protein